MEGQNIKACQEYAKVVTKLLKDININVEQYEIMREAHGVMREKTPQDTKEIENQAEKIHTLIDGIYNRYRVSNGNTIKQPSNCGDNILDFIRKVLNAKPPWFEESKLFQDSLDDPYAVEMIRIIDPLAPPKPGGGRRRSFKKRTTSTRKSIKRKRSRSNRRRYRRTARK